MKALLSDIHGNLEALTAVLADIDAQSGVSDIYSLGDLVGYGPNPEACIDLVKKRCRVHLLGNHDYAMLNEPAGFNPIAAASIIRLRERMKPEANDTTSDKRGRWKFLGTLKERHQDKDTLFVHGSPRDPVFEYVVPTDPVYNPGKMANVFTYFNRLCFVGHTHFPGIFTAEPRFYATIEIDSQNIFKGKTIVNVGSVGQPRDSDTRASYVLFGDNELRFRRVAYDYQTTIAKIKKMSGPDDRSATRLAEGR